MSTWIRSYLLAALLLTQPTAAADPQDPADDWQAVIRAAPYWVSQGVYSNIVTVRRWVLFESGYCSDTDRHVLFDRRGQFLGYISNGPTSEATQHRLNDTRKAMAASGRASTWVRGTASTTGYPFALACNQPHVDLADAMARYLGTLPTERLWGTWDDLSFAGAHSPGSLHEALTYVYQTRAHQQRLDLPPELPRYLAGQLMIESGGQTRAHSAANARGILQLSSAALSDCGIAPANYWHRLAQIDCALKLTNQNARNLRPAFEQRFGHLPAAKRDRLFTLLLIQAYHGGAGRVASLLQDDTLSQPAVYFARHHRRYTAGDIAFGMVFHNQGRDRLGLASLYYVADVQLATETLCQTPRLRNDAFCTL
ncbi:hypothetical protein [Marinobacter sp. X15-166B]|uniref:hypothetical protein n=1 Tax=Marinobacter sp. X15-166B TaxID=1897620 RepID=UPI00085C1948|nr:hypothetical protein [Marinobacter sp. X15-166B]OEY66217.1 hypothetical protein BG841_06940 [Marinobacter sp. X15-166B]